MTTWWDGGRLLGVVIKAVCTLGHNEGRDPMCVCMCVCVWVYYRRRLEWLENGRASRRENVELCADWRPPTQLKFLYHNLLCIYIIYIHIYFTMYTRETRDTRKKYSDKLHKIYYVI